MLLYLFIYLIAAFVNHIDDTDETYGYFEPVHYLFTQGDSPLGGFGMQTWEYSPEYAIRTYTFLAPIWILITTVKSLGLSSHAIPKFVYFYIIKVALGIFTAFSSQSFEASVRKVFGDDISSVLRFFLVVSPGVFYASSSFLPSAVCMSLVMLSFADLLKTKYFMAIMWGCIAVLWSGWPFVGVIFIPIGFAILIKTGSSSGMVGLVKLAVGGLLILTVVGSAAAAVDVYFYQRSTSPTWNILLYNAGGNGDNLYGIEPIQYYLRNLFLNLGISWPLTVLAPIDFIIGLFADKANAVLRSSIYVSAVLWLLILFSRPHKEERFLYPIYPLLLLMSSSVLVSLCDVIAHVVSSPSLNAASGDPPKDAANRSSNYPHPASKHQISRWLTRAALCIAALLGVSRICSNMVNFRGYIHVWRELHDVLSKNDLNEIVSSDNPQIATICTGGDWYYFPSHFFLPDNARLAYVSDNFHGLLPQQFFPINGTWLQPRLPFNDRNKEEEKYYVAYDSCDYFVTLEESPSDVQEASKRPIITFLINHSENYREVLSSKVIDPVASSSSIARAFYIPGYSPMKNKFRLYKVFQKVIK